jgi:hypothetical protein
MLMLYMQFSAVAVAVEATKAEAVAVAEPLLLVLQTF